VDSTPECSIVRSQSSFGKQTKCATGVVSTSLMLSPNTCSVSVSIHNAHGLNPVDYHARMNRLCQNFKVMSPFMSILQHVGSAVISGHEKHFAVGKNFADFDCRFNSCHPVHDNIADEDVNKDIQFAALPRRRAHIVGTVFPVFKMGCNALNLSVASSSAMRSRRMRLRSAIGGEEKSPVRSSLWRVRRRVARTFLGCCDGVLMALGNE
jgi:hypothetical protein